MKFLKTEHIIVPLMLISLMVFIFILNVQGLTTECLGIQPFHYSGLKGVLLAPLLHADWAHLIGNIFPLLALMFLSFQFYGKITYWVLMIGWIVVGLMVWMFPFTLNPHYANTCHIGASGLVYVFAFFLFFSGVFNKKRTLTTLTLLIVVGFGSMFWGILPEEFFGIKDSTISWQSHLSGAIVGSVLSYWFKNKNQVEDKKFEWQGKSELSERDQQLWNTYLEWEMEKEKEDTAEHIKNYYSSENQNST